MQVRPHHRQPRLNKSQAQGLLLSLVLLMLLIVTVVESLAYYSARTRPLENILYPGNISCEVSENMANNTKSDVFIKNTGNTKAYIRVAVIANFSGKNQGEISGKQALAGTDYTITFPNDLGSNWIQVDSYYYLIKPLEANQTSPKLIESLSPKHNSSGYALQVDILAEAIQAEPVTAVQEAWPVIVGADGNLSSP